VTNVVFPKTKKEKIILERDSRSPKKDEPLFWKERRLAASPKKFFMSNLVFFFLFIFLANNKKKLEVRGVERSHFSTRSKTLGFHLCLQQNFII